MGRSAVVINCNPETVSTDYDESDRLYFEELRHEVVSEIVEFEQPHGLVISVGGQTPNNLAMGLAQAGVPIVGTSVNAIDTCENRSKFSKLCDTLRVDQPEWSQFTSIEEAYGFKAQISMAVGVEGEGAEAKANYDKMYGADLWKTNIEEYDRVCKVEPFQRGLKDMGAEVIITGRTRWQGNERAWLDIYEAPRKAGGFGNCNPIAYWTLEDTFDYIAMNKVLHHPLHAKGYPSMGDAKDTIPIPEDGSVYFKDWKFTGDKTEWLGYALERKGRFVGLKNKDGSTKTECGIHVDGAEKTWDRDLWDKATTIKNVESEDDILKLKQDKDGSLVVVYAPWCQFCQAMEGSFEDTSKSAGFEDFKFLKFRGDTRRDFVQKEMDVQSFPTIGFMKNGKFQKYDSEDRSVEALQKFIKSSDTSVAMNEVKA